MHRELVEQLREQAAMSWLVERGQEEPNLRLADVLNEAADAIEELTRKVEILEKQIDDGVEAGKKAIIGIEQYVSQIQEKIKSLDDHQHYSGRYIKSIMGVEHGKSNDSNV